MLQVNNNTDVLQSQVTPYIETIMRASNLDINQAKTLFYYCVFTWCPNPNHKPLLNLNGETGTGKNGLMKVTKNWCYRTVWIKAENITAPTLRDRLENSGTAFIEEADKVKDPKECEIWFKMRYDDTSKSVTYKAQRTNSKQVNYNENVTANHFGYTILHTQNPFQSIELDRRIIRIDIVKDTSRDFALPETDLGNGVLRQIAQDIDWDSEVTGSGSAWDCWLPLMRVAGHLGDIVGDNAFISYAFRCIEAKTEEDNLSKVYEPKGVVLSEIIPCYLACLSANKTKIPIKDITKSIKNREVPFYPNERQVTGIARQLGFEVYYPNNLAHIKVISMGQLESIMERQGIGTEILTEVPPNEPLRLRVSPN